MGTYRRLGLFQSDLSRVPDWVVKSLSKLDLHHAASVSFFQLVGRNYRYIVAPSGQGAAMVDIYRKKRPSSIGEFSGLSVAQSTVNAQPDVSSELNALLGPVWQDPDSDDYD